MGYLIKFIKIRLILILFSSVFLYAEESANKVLIIESKGSTMAQSFSNHLKTNLQLKLSPVVFESTNSDLFHKTMSARLLITIGTEALETVVASGYKGAVLATLINYQQYLTITNAHTEKEQITAIFHQSPIMRQMLLFKELLPTGQRVGLLISEKDKVLVGGYKSFAEKLNLIIEFETVDSHAELSKSLLRLISRTDAVIATNNSDIYNRSTIKSILLTLYRHNKFLIGSSKSFIKPGSVATTYTSMAHLLEEISEDVNYFFTSGFKLRTPHHSKRFAVAINTNVAHSLNLSVQQNQHYSEAIKASEVNLGQADLYE